MGVTTTEALLARLRAALPENSLLTGDDIPPQHHSDWSGGLIALFHRFERFALGWDAQLPRILDDLFDCGIDAVYCDHTDRMTDALGRLETGKSGDRPPA